MIGGTLRPSPAKLVVALCAVLTMMSAGCGAVGHARSAGPQRPPATLETVASPAAEGPAPRSNIGRSFVCPGLAAAEKPVTPRTSRVARATVVCVYSSDKIYRKRSAGDPFRAMLRSSRPLRGSCPADIGPMVVLYWFVSEKHRSKAWIQDAGGCTFLYWPNNDVRLLYGHGVKMLQILVPRLLGG
jgi:hypothetical protein